MPLLNVNNNQSKKNIFSKLEGCVIMTVIVTHFKVYMIYLIQNII